VPPLSGAHESFDDGNGGMRACENLFEFIDAVVVSQPLELLRGGFRLNLAKERILLGSAVETAEACSRFRIVLGDEFTYEFHLDSPKSKIRAVTQSVFVHSSHLQDRRCFFLISSR
jgi:hypothetical protein